MEECEETNQNYALVISPFHIEDCLPLMNKGQSDQHAVWMPEVVRRCALGIPATTLTYINGFADVDCRICLIGK